MWGLKRIGQRAVKVLTPKNDNQGEISLLDVKQLYDTAYAEKEKARVSLRKFKALLAQAIKLDEAYRAQIATDPLRRCGGQIL